MTTPMWCHFTAKVSPGECRGKHDVIAKSYRSAISLSESVIAKSLMYLKAHSLWLLEY